MPLPLQPYLTQMMPLMLYLSCAASCYVFLQTLTLNALRLALSASLSFLRGGLLSAPLLAESNQANLVTLFSQYCMALF
jgi:hypothetical protein